MAGYAGPEAVPEYGLSTHVPWRYSARPYYYANDYAAAWGAAENSMWGHDGYLPFTATEGYPAYDGFSRHPYGYGAYGYQPLSMPVDFGARTVQVPAMTPRTVQVPAMTPRTFQVPAATPQVQYVHHPVASVVPAVTPRVQYVHRPVAPVLWHRPAYTTVHSPPRVIAQREYVANVTESKIQQTNWGRLTTSPKKN